MSRIKCAYKVWEYLYYVIVYCRRAWYSAPRRRIAVTVTVAQAHIQRRHALIIIMIAASRAL